MGKEKKEFKCKRCGFCCIHSSPSFEKEECKRIKKTPQAIARNVKFKKYIFGTKTAPLSKRKAIGIEFCYFTENGLFNYTVAGGAVAYKPCEFLDVDADGKYSCSIYPLRPAVCKDFAIKEWECPNNPEFYGKAPKNKRLKNKKVDSFFKRVFFHLFSGFFVSIMLITAISALILNALHLISDNLSGIISFATVGICSIIVIFLEKRAIRNTLVEN